MTFLFAKDRACCMHGTTLTVVKGSVPPKSQTKGFPLGAKSPQNIVSGKPFKRFIFIMMIKK